MKKVIRVALLSMLVCAMFYTVALAYGSATFTKDDVLYTAKDSASVYYEGDNNDTLCVDASCTITPLIRHYSTADIRKGSRDGTVIATSKRQWDTAIVTNAHVSAPRSSSNLKGFGWWGHE